jgi:hypothetical protein
MPQRVHIKLVAISDTAYSMCLSFSNVVLKAYAAPTLQFILYKTQRNSVNTHFAHLITHNQLG